LRDPIIPNDRFYVRNHFAAPQVASKRWRLRIEGAVKKPLDLDYEQIRKMKPVTLTALLECAGNNRAFLTPKARGVPWQLGAVGNAEWTGVPLSAVLERAGLRDAAVDVVLEGADSGSVAAHAVESVEAGKGYRVFGAAWAGEADVSRVEVSTDGGKTWSRAKLLGDAVPFSWRLWEFTWTPRAGRATVMARATDSRDRVQPLQRDADRRNYMISHVLPVEVQVK
jgi:hypothetical protein